VAASGPFTDAPLLGSQNGGGMDSGHKPVDRPRCRHCGELIGVYEPLILTADSGRHETSVLAEPELFPTDEDCYHRDCWSSSA
jgi:hypothetical protein